MEFIRLNCWLKSGATVRAVPGMDSVGGSYTLKLGSWNEGERRWSCSVGLLWQPTPPDCGSPKPFRPTLCCLVLKAFYSIRGVMRHFVS